MCIFKGVKQVLSLFFLLSAISAHLFAQDKGMVGRWLVVSHTFPDSIVQLELTAGAIDSSRSHTGFYFNADRTIQLYNYNARKLKVCGNGMMVLTSGSWAIEKKNLRIKLTGKYIAERNFDYNLLYKIKTATQPKRHSSKESSPKQITLIRISN